MALTNFQATMNTANGSSDTLPSRASTPEVEEPSVLSNILDVLHASMQESLFEKTPNPYLPQSVFKEIFSTTGREAQVLALFGRDPNNATTLDRLLVQHVLQHSRKLLLINIFIELKTNDLYIVMSTFQRHNFTDMKLPVDKWPMDRLAADEKKHPLALLELNRPRGQSRIWKNRNISKFQRAQHRFLAPVISTKHALHDFHQCTIPFIAKHNVTNKGAFGTVYKYEIDPDHFEDHLSGSRQPPLPNTNSNHGTCIANVVAVKEIRKDGTEVALHWETEVKALARMNTLHQEHIVRFITAFRRGTPNDLEHYVMFEWADGGNLSDLWAADPVPELSTERVQWAIQQLHGMAQALSKAHYLEEDGLHNGASYRHGDLKPANILWFKQGAGKFGTLKIGDWGEAKEHGQLTALRHDTTAQYGTRRYEPPEVVTGMQSSLVDKVKFARSRLYDIWGIGCITLEFIIWLMYGLEELKRFNHENVGLYGISDMFYEVSPGRPPKVHAVVENWTRHMAKDPRCTSKKTALGDLLDIVRNGLLIVKLPRDGGARISCGQQQHVVNGKDQKDFSSPNHYSNFASDGEDFISIEVTPSEQDVSLAIPGEPQRCLATDYERLLRNILDKEESIGYWSQDVSRPPPVESGLSNFLSVKVRPMARNISGHLLEDLDKKDYGPTKIDPEDWAFGRDNEFAAKMYSLLRSSKRTPPYTAPASSLLCDHCVTVRSDIWSPLFRTTYNVSKLERNSTRKICDLCCLIWHTCTSNADAQSPTVKLQRHGSTLRMNGEKVPAFVILRNDARSRASDVQIGFPELPVPGKDVHLDILRGWLQTCDREHSCQPKNKNKSESPVNNDLVARMPTRLINVVDSGEDIVRLEETKECEGDDWIALSYRWGSLPHFSTSLGNLKAHMTGMSLISLPQTFQDAIKVTRSLGKRYLWIDSICIIQGEGGDFSQESKRMEHVYSGAYCVLAASCATDQRSGFLIPREHHREYVALEDSEGSDGIFYVCQRIENFKDHVQKGVLSQRGWVLQEHALARRTIFFTEYQTYWECGHGIRCETMVNMKNDSAALLGDPEFPKILSPNTAGKGEQIIRFQELYQQYSRLSLTTDYDRPAAIGGLEQRLLRTMEVKGGFGVFDDCDNNKGLLRRSLLWHRGRDTFTLQDIYFPANREKVPSWSWMSVSGGINYFFLEFNGYDWQDIKSPWSPSVKADIRNVILAPTYGLKQPRSTSKDSDIIFDKPDPPNNVRAIVLGIEKGPKAYQDKRHYILVVVVVVSDPNLRCKRVGAGYVPGSYLTGDSIQYALI